jgi:hypothetical protein
MPKSLAASPPQSALDEGRLPDAADLAEFFGVSLWWIRNEFIKAVPPKKVGRLNRWESW